MYLYNDIRNNQFIDWDLIELIVSNSIICEKLCPYTEPVFDTIYCACDEHSFHCNFAFKKCLAINYLYKIMNNFNIASDNLNCTKINTINLQFPLAIYNCKL